MYAGFKHGEYFGFCDQEYKSISNHVSVCRLISECWMNRILQKKNSLKRYFLSESFSNKK